MKIDGNIARVGKFDLNVHVLEPSSENEHRYVIEVTADSRQRVGQYFPTHELRHLRPSDLPNSLYFFAEGIDSSLTQFRNICFLKLTKQLDETKLSLVICFQHWDWHLPENLNHFAERYAKSLQESEDFSVIAEAEPDDVGVSIISSTVAPSTQDLHATYLQLAAHCLKTYRATLAQSHNASSSSELPSILKGKPLPSLDDTRGSRWWVRYAIVPLLGSGAFAAIVIALIALFKY